jgi:uncharacterized protein YbjT (DUF2867 family)
MKILVTGAGGSLGSRLAAALLAGARDMPAVATLVAADTAVGSIDDPRVQWRTGTIADERFTQSVVEDRVDLVYHLAAVVSGQAEAEFDLGMRVNVDATRARVRTSDLEPRRTVNFPGLSVTPGQMLDSLERVAGSAARARVRNSLDERVLQIVRSWPGRFEVSRALHLGFSADRDIDGIIRQFVDSRQGAA